MPLYEYDCPGCGQLFEKHVPMAEANDTTCPHCGNSHPKRRLPRVNIKGKAQSDNAHFDDSSSSCGCGGSCACASHSALN